MVEDLHQLIGTILREHSPQEIPLFKSQGMELLRINLKGTKRQPIDESTFGPDLESGLLMLHLVAGTIQLVELYHSSRRLREEARHQKELQRLWEECLIKRGVPPTLASQIPVQHGPELFRILDSDGQRNDA